MTVTITRSQTGQVRAATRDVGGLEVLAISPTTWRVRAAELPEGADVLGVIQVIGDTYELMQIGAPLTRYYFASLEEAVGYLAGRG